MSQAPAIDPNTLQTRYKREGGFDRERKQLLEGFRQLPVHGQLQEAVRAAVQAAAGEMRPGDARATAELQRAVWADASVARLVEQAVKAQVFAARDTRDRVLEQMDDIRREVLQLPPREEEAKPEPHGSLESLY